MVLDFLVSVKVRGGAKGISGIYILRSPLGADSPDGAAALLESAEAFGPSAVYASADFLASSLLSAGEKPQGEGDFRVTMLLTGKGEARILRIKPSPIK